MIHHFLGRADVVFGVGTSFTRTNYGRAIPPYKVNHPTRPTTRPT